MMNTFLGLALTRAFVTEMNGHIHAESQVGVGSIFHVRLDNIQMAEETAVETLEQEAVDIQQTEEEVANWSFADLSEDARLKLPALIAHLEGMSATCEALSHTLTINDVENFAIQIMQLGETYQVPPVANWGHQLAEQSSLFDLDNVAKTLAHYPECIQNLKRIVNL